MTSFLWKQQEANHSPIMHLANVVAQTYTHTAHACAGTEWLQGLPAARSEGWEAVLADTKVMHVPHASMASKKGYEKLLGGAWPDVLQLSAATQGRLGCHACMQGACSTALPQVSS